MNCAEVAALSPLYLSNELDPARAEEFSTHLETCASCAAFIQDQRLLDSRVRAEILAEDVSCPGLEVRIREQLASTPTARARGAWILRLAVAASLSAVLLGAGAYLLSFRTSKLVSDAAIDHHREIVERQPRRWISDSSGIKALASREAVPASALAALAPTGFQLKGARLCLLGGQPFLHLVYATQGGGQHQEISIFLRGADNHRLGGRKLEIVNGRRIYASDVAQEQVACFQTAQLIAMFVADDPGQALSLARFAATVL